MTRAAALAIIIATSFLLVRLDMLGEIGYLELWSCIAIFAGSFAILTRYFK